MKPDSAKAIFCTRLKTARKAKGYTQEKLGIAAGLDEFIASPRINRYEQGVNSPDIELANNIAKSLDVPLAYLYCMDDELAELILYAQHLSNGQIKELIDSLAVK